jgi:hypothetical protein
MPAGRTAPRHVIRSIEFAGATTGEEVKDRAVFMIEAINGAMNLLTGGGRIDFDGVIEVQPDGKLNYFLFPEPIVARSRVHAAALEHGGTSAPPAPSPAQRWYKSGTTDRVVADMLVRFGKQTSWYDLYKTYECVRRLYGGEQKLMSRPWASKAEVERFTRTADYYHRHAYDPAKQPPKNPMSIRDAAEIIRGLVGQTLKEKISKG